jgi:hypothetical protein
LTARDFRSEVLTKKGRQRLRARVAAVRKDQVLLIEVPSAEVSLHRLVAAADLSPSARVLDTIAGRNSSICLAIVTACRRTS